MTNNAHNNAQSRRNNLGSKSTSIQVTIGEYRYYVQKVSFEEAKEFCKKLSRIVIFSKSGPDVIKGNITDDVLSEILSKNYLRGFHQSKNIFFIEVGLKRVPHSWEVVLFGHARSPKMHKSFPMQAKSKSYYNSVLMSHSGAHKTSQPTFEKPRTMKRRYSKCIIVVHDKFGQKENFTSVQEFRLKIKWPNHEVATSEKKDDVKPRNKKKGK